MLMKLLKWNICLLALLFLSMSSCSSDERLDQKPANEEYLEKAKTILNGDIVLSTKATMSGVDKTLLPQGCPTKFNFKWEKDSMQLSLNGFSVGKMPLIVYFSCKCKFMQLNYYEKNEYGGDGWIKFVGKDGSVTGDNKDDSGVQKGSGAGVIGYLNVKTEELIFIVDYNMMSVRSECFLQTIDKNRIKNYEEEFAQYERDLEAYKKEHGL
ncbi:MAG: DUF4903 domain-containing protein [Bacteroides heparinolyticus]|nr:DUF4903 family protein [Bacteroides heparinolyticus]MCF0257116.1 DUF4903 family protein [Bacteroides heparinolyticus]MCI6213329.1 DUF4903 domain-containing protein [Bacteroides heparinolyticus]